MKRCNYSIHLFLIACCTGFKLLKNQHEQVVSDFPTKTLRERLKFTLIIPIATGKYMTVLER
jgi:hypothetical protein